MHRHRPEGDLAAARAAARQRAWELTGDAAPGAGGALITLDIDATIVTSCAEKDQAMRRWNKTFWIVPILSVRCVNLWVRLSVYFGRMPGGSAGNVDL